MIFALYYGPDIIHHIPIQNQWRRPQNYPECQPSGAAISNARNQYWCRKILQKRFQKIFFFKVSSASTDALQHQKLKLYLHFTKKSLEVIRINFVEIPWLVSLLKTRVFTFPDATFHRLQRRFATHQRLDHLHLTEKGLAVVTNFLGTRFDTTLWSKLINSAHSRNFLPFFRVRVFLCNRWFLQSTQAIGLHRPQASRIYVCIMIIFVFHRRVCVHYDFDWPNHNVPQWWSL